MHITDSVIKEEGSDLMWSVEKNLIKYSAGEARVVNVLEGWLSPESRRQC